MGDKTGRVLVCGSRDYEDRVTLERILDKLAAVFRVTVIIHGGARGADELAGAWAHRNGLVTEVYEADWRNGPRGGNERNQRMLDRGKPDLVIAFPLPGSRGTWDMIGRARMADVPCWIMPTDESKIDAIGEGVYL